VTLLSDFPLLGDSAPVREAAFHCAGGARWRGGQARRRARGPKGVWWSAALTWWSPGTCAARV